MPSSMVSLAPFRSVWVAGYVSEKLYVAAADTKRAVVTHR